MTRRTILYFLALVGFSFSAAFETRFQSNFLSAEIETLLNLEVLSSETVLTYEGKQYFPQANCSRILKEFSSAAANYTLCGASFARPVNLCLQCKGHYLKVKRKYEDMDKYDQDNVTCREVLTKQDKLNIVTSVYNFITDSNSIWAMGNCNNCFKDHDPANSISQEAHTYIQKLQDTWNCFNNFANLSLQERDLFLKNPHNYTILCNNCSDTYFETRKYFWGTLVPSTKLGDYGAVCIDLKDAFNFTGYIWGIEFHCNSGLEMGGFWVLILIPCTFLVLITYGVPALLIPWWKGSSLKVLNLLAVPDHYDKAESVQDTFMPNLRKFIQTTRSDAEESLSVKAEENLELQDELFKLAEVLQTAKSNQFQFADEKERAEVLETMTDVLTMLMKKGDHEVNSDKSSGQIPFKEQVRRRRISRRGMSSGRPEVNWKDFGPYVEPERSNHVQSLSVEDPVEL